MQDLQLTEFDGHSADFQVNWLTDCQIVNPLTMVKSTHCKKLLLKAFVFKGSLLTAEDLGSRLNCLS